MPINTPTGYLDITNATLRGSKIVTTGFVGIANANPTNHLSVGSNLHINDTHSNVLQISGNINAASVVLGGISIAPTFDLEIVTNTGNTTPYTVEFNNTATAFVTTANATIGDTLTASKLVGDGSGISAIQSSNVTDFASNVSRITALETDLGNNSARITNLSSNLSDNSARITNLSSNLSDNSARITNLSSNLSDNSSRITALETGNMSISGDKTFTGDIIFESNIHMNGGNVLVANTVNLTVSDPIIELGSNNSGTNDLGIIMTRPNNNSNVAFVYDESDDILRMGYTLNGANDSIVELDSNALAVSVQGALSAGSNLEVGTANLFVDTTTSNVGVGISSPAYKLDVDGDINLSTGSTLKINGTDAVFSNWTASGSDIYRSSGNVGIGTTSPDEKLHIYTNDTSHSQLTLRNNESTARTGIRIKNSAGQDFTLQHVGGSSAGSNAAIIENFSQVNGGIEFYSKGDGQYTFHTTDSNDVRLRILNNGNVGIGTTSPSSSLHVNLGNASGEQHIRATQTSLASSTAGIRFGDSTWDAFIDHSHGAKDLMNFGFYRNPTRQVNMVLTHEGNVGIGTTSPTAKLDVEYNQGTLSSYNYSTTSTWHGKGLCLNGGSNSGGFLYGHDINHSIFLRQSPFSTSDHNAYCNVGYHAFYTGGHIQNQTERLRITSDGKVGIGRTDPDYLLDVNGTTRVGNVLYVGKNTNDETAKSIFFGGTYGDNAYDHAVIERRVWSTGTEKQELLLFCGNDIGGGSGSDRIRLKGAEILFDTLNASTDRVTENTKMLIKSDGKIEVDEYISQSNFPIASLSDSRARNITNVVLDSGNFYNKTWVNNGNHFNSSNGRFTCPIDGIYRIYFRCSADSGSTGNNVRLQKNGGTINEAYHGGQVDRHSVSSEAIVSCNANDYLLVQVSQLFCMGGTQHKQVTFQLLA